MRDYIMLTEDEILGTLDEALSCPDVVPPLPELPRHAAALEDAAVQVRDVEEADRASRARVALVSKATKASAAEAAGVTVFRLDVEDSWLRCRCGKRMVVIVGGVDDRPADLHVCLECDPAPEAAWHINSSTVEGSS